MSVLLIRVSFYTIASTPVNKYSLGRRRPVALTFIDSDEYDIPIGDVGTEITEIDVSAGVPAGRRLIPLQRERT